MHKKMAVHNWIILIMAVLHFSYPGECKKEETTPTETPTTTQKIFEIIDYTIFDPSGNNNGRLNPGETVDLFIILKNVSQDTTPRLQLTITTDEPGVTIINNTTSYSRIAPADLAISEHALGLNIGTDMTKDTVALAVEIVEEETGVSMQMDQLGVLSEQPLYACVETCEIVSGTRDTLKVRLSVCNESMTPYTNVGVWIRQVQACGAAGFSFTPFDEDVDGDGVPDRSSNKVLYNPLATPGCKDATSAVCEEFEFEIEVPAGGSLDELECVHIFTRIYYEGKTICRFNQVIGDFQEREFWARIRP